MPETFASLGVAFRFWTPVIAVVLLAVAYVAYLRTTPPISGPLRIGLTLLRAVAFLFLVLILLDPRFVRSTSEKEPAKVVALIDRSASMALPDTGWEGGRATRFGTAVETAGRLGKEVGDRGGEFQRLFFSSGLSEEPADSVRPDGQGTDIFSSIQDAYRRYEGEHVTAFVVLTDGAETEERLVRPGLPALPVFAVGLGDTAMPEDVRIKDVDYNTVVRAPSRSSIHTKLCYSGRRQKRVSLRLLEGNRVVFERDTVLSPSVSEVVQEIPVRYEEAARRHFSLVADVEGYDAERENNRRDIVVEAEKAKAKLLIVDLQPGWDLHFLTDLLRRDQTFDFEVFSIPDAKNDSLGKIRDPGRFLNSLSESDAVVLVSVNDAFVTAEVAEGIKRFVRDRGGGLLVMPGDASLFEHPRAWNRMLDLLPVRGTPPFRWNLQYTSVTPGAQAGDNPITSHLLPLLNQSEWQERSPLLGFYGAIAASNVGEVLLRVKGRQVPAVTYRTVGKGRVAAVTVGPLWRWKFLSDNNTVYDEIVSRLLEVLSRGEETDRFVIVAKKNVFEAGEAPVFFAELFNEKMQPVTGAPVRLEIARLDDGGNETPLDIVSMHRENTQSTRFKSALPPLSPGRYLVRGQAELPERSIESRPIEIQVSSTSVEYGRVDQDQEFLAGLARRTGGVYVAPDAAESLAGRIDLTPRVVSSLSETKLRTSALLFALILALLTTEWVLRKRAGLI